MSYQQMVEWVFTEILNGLMQGKSLKHIAENIVVGLSNIVHNNLKDKQVK